MDRLNLVVKVVIVEHIDVVAIATLCYTNYDVTTIARHLINLLRVCNKILRV